MLTVFLQKIRMHIILMLMEKSGVSQYTERVVIGLKKQDWNRRSLLFQ